MEIKRRIGLNPIVIVSRDYASVLDGVSYVTPDVVKEGWFDGMSTARRMALQKYGSVIVPAWWHDPETVQDLVTDMNQNGVRVLQSHGRNWGVNINTHPDFATSMWRRAGFTREEMLTLPLVFDRRNKDREEELCKKHIYGNKPLLLYNFTGVSSPFGYVPEVMRLMRDYQADFFMLDLGMVRCARIYDLLGLYDRAVGLITIDSATMHLAPASKVPTIWLTVPGWGKSTPRGNVALHVQYDQTPKRLEEIRAVLEKWRTK
jgi:hypothetical protein